MATAAASTRPETSSLDRMFPTWTPTVFWLMNRRSPISRFVRPWATSARTSRSRPLSPNVSGARGRPADRRRSRGPASECPLVRSVGSGIAGDAGPDRDEPAAAGALSEASRRLPAAGRSAPGRQARAARGATASRRAGDRARPPPGAAPGHRSARSDPAPEASIASAWRQRASATSYGASRARPAARPRDPRPRDRRRPRAVAGTRGPSRETPRRHGANRPSSARRRPGRARSPPSSTSAVRCRAAASGASWRCSRASSGARRVDLGDHRGHPRHEQPLLGGPDARPAAIDRPAGVGDVAAPQRERGGRQVVRAGQLRLADAHRIRGSSGRAGATPPRRRRSRSRRWRAGGPTPQVDDADRQPAHRAAAQLARLRPAAEEEQRVGDVARQEVAVDGLEAGAPGVLDPRVGDLDRLGPAAHQVEDGRQVGADAEQGVRVVELEGGPFGLAQQLDRRGRVAAPGERHGERRRSRGPPAPGPTGSQARATLIASRARRCASEKMPSSILSWASAATTVARSGLGSRGTSSTARRAACIAPGRVAGGPADLRQPLVEQTEPDAIASGVEPADGRFEEGRRPRGPPDREGRLRGADLEIDAIRGGPRPDDGPRRPVRGPSGRDSASSSAASSSAAACRSAGGRAPPRSPPSGPRADRTRRASVPPRPTAARRGWRPARRGSGSGRSAAGRADDGLADRSRGGSDGVVALDQEAVGERLGPAGPQVGVEHAVADARAGHRPGRAPGSCRPRTPRPPRRAGPR